MIGAFTLPLKSRNGRLVIIDIVMAMNMATHHCYTVDVLIAGLHLTSWRPCWRTLNKRVLIISFAWDTNMATMSVVFCVSWDCEKTKNCFLSYLLLLL